MSLNLMDAQCVTADKVLPSKLLSSTTENLGKDLLVKFECKVNIISEIWENAVLLHLKANNIIKLCLY